MCLASRAKIIHHNCWSDYLEWLLAIPLVIMTLVLSEGLDHQFQLENKLVATHES